MAGPFITMKESRIIRALACAAALALAGVAACYAQGAREKDLIATAPMFVELRPQVAAPAAKGGAKDDVAAPAAPTAYGVASMRVHGTGAEQRYYTLLAMRDGASVIVFSADGARLAQIPATPYITAMGTVAPRSAAASATEATPAGAGRPIQPAGPGPAAATLLMPPAQSKEAKLEYATDFDVDADGRVIIADRGGNAIKIYDSAGALLSAIPVQAPVSVAALPEGEIAVTCLRAEKLVQVYALRASALGGASQWKVVREFGAPADITGDAAAKELNRYVNIGRLSHDAEGNVYYTFFYLPEPTVRKYDRWGFLVTEFELTTPEFQPSAQSARRAIERLRSSRFNFGGSSLPILHPSVTALGVDPVTQDMWVAMGTQLLHFDKDGARRGTYRSYAPDLQRVEATSILVEPDRLVISSDVIGAFAFPRPDKQKQ